VERLIETLRAPGTTIWVFLASAVMFFGSIALAWYLILRLPADYLTSQQPITGFRSRHPIVAVSLAVLRNLFGIMLLVSGFIMLFIPGQGVLFMFLGMTLMDFPGKRHVVRRMLTWKNTLGVINRIRAKSDRPPVDAPDDAAHRDNPERPDDPRDSNGDASAVQSADEHTQ